MKIQVVHRDGVLETLDVKGPLQIVDGREHMNHFTDASGTDHYFNLDGTYDGWGRGCVEATSEEARWLVEDIESRRVRAPHVEQP